MLHLNLLLLISGGQIVVKIRVLLNNFMIFGDKLSSASRSIIVENIGNTVSVTCVHDAETCEQM
ncbi:MAG: hypothetical protein LBQ66_02625 [Planctomycetaceae bacterium]|jgi:hypothetical protein|nr:hypothetical protein [Planctomycetaceae bacterium]